MSNTNQSSPLITRRKFLRRGTVTLVGAGLSSSASASLIWRRRSEGREKVLLDTDIGSDIDDAVCLAYLLAHPHCNLLGITTVTGEADKRAQLASALCKVAGRDIPIYPGARQPLIVTQKQQSAQQAVKLPNWNHLSTFPQSESITFLKETIRSQPGEVILLAVGPLTNIALLFATDPEIPQLLKGLVTMCGKFTDYPSPWGKKEWNVIVDPHAAAIVFQNHPPIHRSIGLDVTLQVKMAPDQVKARFAGIPLLESVYDFSKVWFEERDVLHFHDPLAAATLFNDQICAFEKGTVTIDLNTTDQLGFTHWRPGSGPHEVASTIRPNRFFEEYFAAFK